MRSLLVGRDHVGCLYHDPTKEAFIYLTSKVISASALRQRHSGLCLYYYFTCCFVYNFPSKLLSSSYKIIAISIYSKWKFIKNNKYCYLPLDSNFFTGIYI